MTAFQKKLWLGLGIMVLATPLGLILPEKFGASDAWGEWSTETIRKMLGYVPRGLQRLGELWSAPLADYAFGENASPAMQFAAYIISGLLGILLVGGVVFFIKMFFLNRNDER